jgi:alpha-glucuronidase
MTSSTTDVHPAWLPDAALRPLGSRRVHVTGDGPLVPTVRDEVRRAVATHGGAIVDDPATADLVLLVDEAVDGAEAFVVGRRGGVTTVRAGGDAGLLHGLHHVVRRGEGAFGADHGDESHAPVQPVRMLDHWDNMTVHPVMGQVERGYAGGSLFYEDGRVRDDLSRVGRYARLLGSVGINAVGLNNVNVHATEARLLTDALPDVARLADVFRPHGIRVYLSVSFAAPITVGGLPSSDPLDPDVQAWWADAVARV